VQNLEIIIFAVIAAFLVFRLRDVLGKRTGHQDKSKFDPFSGNDDQQNDDFQEDDSNVIPLPQSYDHIVEPVEPQNSDVEKSAEAGLRAIQAADGSFSAETFPGGAEGAFGMIVDAFSDGDENALKGLLSKEVFAGFKGAIDDRNANNQTLGTTLVGITKSTISHAELDGKMALVTVKFVSEQISVLKNEEGAIVDGHPSDIVKITDLWTFARNTASRDPNWTLIANETPE
jgi:predicted lipid-binding transport protein (Tim44 family)